MKRGINNYEESAAHSAGDHLVGSSQPRLRGFPECLWNLLSEVSST